MYSNSWACSEWISAIKHAVSSELVGRSWTILDYVQIEKNHDGKVDGMDDLGLITVTVSIGATRNEDIQVFVRVDN